VGDFISRLNCPVLRQSYKYSGRLLENRLFLKTVFLRDLSQVLPCSGRKSPFEIASFSTLNNIMTAPSGSQADPDAEIDLSSRTRISAMLREDWAQSAKEGGNDNRLWEDVFNLVSSTSSRYTGSDVPIQFFEEDMHDLWYLFFQASMNISGERAEQDRLVMQILYARELGVLLRKGENMEIIGQAVTRDGKIYKDLPFLVGDMTDYWIRESGSMSTNQRQNFASFLANLSAAGVADDKLCGCALIILRDTLESTTRLGKGTPSPTVVSERQDYQVEQDDHRNGEALSIAELLPAANAWIFYAGHKIIQLSDNSVNIFPVQVGMLGDLARAEGVIPENRGFSPQRWLFWVKRLGEIEKSETVGEGEAGIATFARGMMNSMLNMVTSSDSMMTRELARQEKLPYQWVLEGKLGPPSS
jgi:hypothetical protein